MLSMEPLPATPGSNKKTSEKVWRCAWKGCGFLLATLALSCDDEPYLTLPENFGWSDEKRCFFRMERSGKRSQLSKQKKEKLSRQAAEEKQRRADIQAGLVEPYRFEGPNDVSITPYELRWEKQRAKHPKIHLTKDDLPKNIVCPECSNCSKISSIVPLERST